MTWFVYIARCSDGSLYTGVTTDPDRRESLHNAGRGAAYTRSRRPVRLVYRESVRDHGAALRREAAIKRLARAQKEQMVTDRKAGEFAGFGREAVSFLRSLARNLHNADQHIDGLHWPFSKRQDAGYQYRRRFVR